MKTKLSVTFASTDFRNKGGVASVLWRKATIADCYIEIPSVRRRRLATNNNKIEVEIYGKDNHKWRKADKLRYRRLAEDEDLMRLATWQQIITNCEDEIYGEG